MGTERNLTLSELINYMRKFDDEFINRPSAPEIDLPIVKKLREEKKRRGRTRK